MVFPTSTGKRLAVRRLLPNEYTAAQPEIYTPGRACESDGSAWMPLFPVSLWTRSVSKCCACEAMCNHTTAWHVEACRALAWCLLCAWSCFLVSWHDTRSQVVQSRGYRAFHPRPPPDTQHKLPLRPALFLSFANSSSLALCHTPPAETQTSPARIATRILAPNQSASLARHRLKIRSCA